MFILTWSDSDLCHFIVENSQFSNKCPVDNKPQGSQPWARGLRDLRGEQSKSPLPDLRIAFQSCDINRGHEARIYSWHTQLIFPAKTEIKWCRANLICSYIHKIYVPLTWLKSNIKILIIFHLEYSQSSPIDQCLPLTHYQLYSQTITHLLISRKFLMHPAKTDLPLQGFSHE